MLPFLAGLKSEPTCTLKNTIKGRINNLLSSKGASDPLNVILTVHEKFSDILKVSGARCWGEHGPGVWFFLLRFFFFFLLCIRVCGWLAWFEFRSSCLLLVGWKRDGETYVCSPGAAVRSGAFVNKNGGSMLESCALGPYEKNQLFELWSVLSNPPLSLSVCV